MAPSGGSFGGDAWSDSDSITDPILNSDPYLCSSDSVSSCSKSNKTNSPEERYKSSRFVLLIMGAMVALAFMWPSKATTSVVKLQVGLLGTARTLQKDLDLIAETAQTSTRNDLSRVLTGATEALLHHPDYCISGYSSVAHNQSVKDAQKSFNQISLEERAKFDEDTLVNVNNNKRIRRKSSTERPTGLKNEFIVVTVLVGVKGRHEFPTINDSSDLKKALQNLGSIRSSDLLAVRVLWTPQQENDILSEQELLKNYPFLKWF